jgi:hypothetical protein
MKTNNDGNKTEVFTTTCCCCGLMLMFITSLILLPYELFFASAVVILYFLQRLEKKMINKPAQTPLMMRPGKRDEAAAEPFLPHREHRAAAQTMSALPVNIPVTVDGTAITTHAAEYKYIVDDDHLHKPKTDFEKNGINKRILTHLVAEEKPA